LTPLDTRDEEGTNVTFQFAAAAGADASARAGGVEPGADVTADSDSMT
jgi:hypothetical protein